MAHGLKKADLQTLAQTKVDDALLLFDRGRFSNAYYLGGYAVEFALKACIAARIETDTIPDKKFVTSIFTHDLVTLINVSGLSNELKKQENSDDEFHANWGIVSKWSEQKRYEVSDRSTTHYFLHAIIDQYHGVLPWIKNFW
ncbi:HEPN domain-containing protein [Fodinicurvata fenggangensis]|uniref:HEPN domain-containing protein n=1 Tax=Fodinicurvata fenggangensis TaxID=1121830 RepID=UPI0012DF4886|nr:HEPN domain-containing protein [Fodinicurvata fenggangensis]